MVVVCCIDIGSWDAILVGDFAGVKETEVVGMHEGGNVFVNHNDVLICRHPFSHVMPVAIPA